MARSPTTLTTDDTATASLQVEAQAPQGEAAKRKPRAGSKIARVIALLERADGATIAEMMAATNWQQHTIRGTLAGSIPKKFGRTVSSERVEGRGRVYRIAILTP
jgi:hypothetical protein